MRNLAICVNTNDLQGQIVSYSNKVFADTSSYIVHANGQIKKIWVRKPTRRADLNPPDAQ